jgi:hypothetical protein
VALPGEEVGAVGVAVVVGVAVCVEAEVALPLSEAGGVDDAVVIEVGGISLRHRDAAAKQHR